MRYLLITTKYIQDLDIFTVFYLEFLPFKRLFIKRFLRAHERPENLEYFLSDYFWNGHLRTKFLFS